MKYQLGNGRNITIDDNYLERCMKALNISKEEAITMYLEDEGILVNEEQQELVEKTKGQKLSGAKAVDKPKKKRAATKKVDEVKKSIIEYLEMALNDYEDFQIENVKITNDQKIIEFEVDGAHFKLDLIKQRQKKEN